MSVFDQTNGISYATLSAAITGSSSNDVLLVPAGSHVENFPDITDNLTIDAVGGLASLTSPQPIPVNGRAILNVPFDADASLSISGLRISGAIDDAAISNGAGILFETGNGLLTVTNSWIHDNQDGILTGGPDAASPGGIMSVIVSHPEINNNGVDQSNAVRRGLEQFVSPGGGAGTRHVSRFRRGETGELRDAVVRCAERGGGTGRETVPAGRAPTGTEAGRCGTKTNFGHGRNICESVR